MRKQRAVCKVYSVEGCVFVAKTFYQTHNSVTLQTVSEEIHHITGTSKTYIRPPASESEKICDTMCQVTRYQRSINTRHHATGFDVWLCRYSD
jgi:hypothetical protein